LDPGFLGSPVDRLSLESPDVLGSPVLRLDLGNPESLAYRQYLENPAGQLSLGNPEDLGLCYRRPEDPGNLEDQYILGSLEDQ
jgi:hypothetical protein